MEALSYLDLKTVAIIGLVLHTALALVMLQTHLTRKTYPGFLSWTIGQVCWVLASIAFFARPLIGEALSIILCNPMFFLFAMLMHHGLARFYAYKNRKRLMTVDVAVACAGLALIYWHFFVVQDTNVRVVANSLVIGVILARTGWEPLLIPKARRSPAQVSISLSLWLVAALLIIRAAVATQDSQYSSMQLQDPMLKAVMATGLFGMVLVVFGFISLMHARLEEELLEAQASLREQANTDPLTGLLNRRGFTEVASHDILMAARYGHPVSLIMFDLDHFKLVNDTHGHAVGDQVLTSVGLLCLKAMREVDTVARLGGEEFAVLMPQTDLEGARLTAERLRHMLRGVWKTAGSAVATTASFGVAELDDEGLAAMMSRADARMYRSKREGRDRVCADG